MCGRFGLFPELDALAEQFNFDPSIMHDIYHPRWNIPPTASVLTIHNDSQESIPSKNSARLLRWGMAGARSKKGSKVSRPLFNARAETVHKLLSFREAFRGRRCLIPASGFYEWKKGSSAKRTPMWFERKDNAPVAFAGIWSSERTPDGDIDSCAIITCAANNLVAPIHHRMPVILSPDTYHQWLGEDEDSDALLALLQTQEWHEISYHLVSSEVNRAANDYPSLIERASQELQFDLISAAPC